MTASAQAVPGLQLYRRLLTYVWPYKLGFGIAVLGMLLLALSSTAFTALMKLLIDDGFIKRDPGMITLLPFLFLATYTVRALAGLIADYSVSWMGRRVIFDLRDRLFQRLTYLPCSYFDKQPSGSLISKLIFDVEQVAGAATGAIFALIKDGLTVLLMLGWLLYLNWQLTLIIIILIPFFLFFIRLMTSRLRVASQRIQESIGRISQVSQEAVEGQRVIKAYGAQEIEQASFTNENQFNLRQNLRRAATSAIGMAIIMILAGGGLALVIYLALRMSGLTAGDFTSYITAVMWVMNPVRRLAKVNEKVQVGIAAAGSVFDLLDTPAEEDTGVKTLDRVRGRIEFQHVGFAYESKLESVLHDISFTIEPGQTLALVGASGSGKSTIASLLLRFYRPASGRITLDDVNINDVTLSDLRHHMALVTQETILFNDSVKANIAYGSNGEVDVARLQQAIKAARVDEFIATLPLGLDSIIGEKGLRLSGGQRQRIAIARALYKNAPILVLDEATSSLDSKSERYVQEAMDTLMQDRTTLVIAHRLSTIEHADKIVVVDSGRIVETGSHAELIQHSGLYAGLHRLQFRTDKPQQHVG